MMPDDAKHGQSLATAGLPLEDVIRWETGPGSLTNDPVADGRAHSEYWLLCHQLLDRLPEKPRRNSIERHAAEAILSTARSSREQFLRAHSAWVYHALTGGCSKFIRIEDLVYDAAALIPGLAPTRADVSREAARDLADKDGIEFDQGLLLAHFLADQGTGLHLCHAMLLPRPESAELTERFARNGALDLGPASLERRGKAVVLTGSNPRFLNAEDDTNLDTTEAAVDVAIMDPNTEIAVIRGGWVDQPKHGRRRVLGAGINLTHLYRGRIPFIWYLERDLGYVHKLLRGIARADVLPDDVHGPGIEKPWIAAVEGFAIGGHCQILLCMDFIIAANDAVLTLPARKEGIIPGFANLRLPRFTGDRIARQAIQNERVLRCDSLEGRLICDDVVPSADMDSAIERTVDRLTSSGAVSAIANRRMFRVTQEPLDLFRRYASVYAREQAYCHFSRALLDNLEKNWDAKNRSL